MYTSNSDYLQMLIKIHHTEELPSFYAVICSPRAKLTKLGVYPLFPTACHKTVENSSCEGWLRGVTQGCRSAGEGQTPGSLSEADRPVPGPLVISAKFTSSFLSSVKLQKAKSINSQSRRPSRVQNL